MSCRHTLLKSSLKPSSSKLNQQCLRFRLPNPSHPFNVATPPLRPAERSILFSGKSVRLFDDAHSAASSHAPKKGCGVREVWRSQTCTSGSPFFCLLFFGEAKKSKCPVGMRRMVKTTPNANHKAVTQSVICSTTHISAQTNFSDPKLHFRLPTPYPSTPKELPHLLPHSTNTQAPTFALRYALFPQTN